jgi:peptidoglycan/xylan/chitin deacetylase (PgdA/CDA1 family)
VLLHREALCRWSEKGIAVGAHSRTHPDLTTVGLGEARGEIAGSRSDLEAVLELPVRAFAYPYGHVNPAVRGIAASEYELAFTITEGCNSPRTDRYALRRTMVQPGDGEFRLAQRVRLGRAPTQLARQRAGLLRQRVTRGYRSSRR